MLKIEAEEAHLFLQQGEVEDALDWLQGRGLSHTDEVSLTYVLEYLVLARVLLSLIWRQGQAFQPKIRRWFHRPT
jgi:hypothetical protein